MMDDTVDAALKNKSTADPFLAAIFRAEYINHRAGGAVIAPWEVKDLPDEWLIAYEALQDAPAREAQRKRLEKYHDEFKRNHPQYGRGRRQ